METKLVQGKGRDIWHRCGFTDGWEVPRVGLSRGLLLAWMPRQSVSIIFESTHLIHINFLDNKGLPTSITFVYGHPKLARRAKVWHQLLAFKTKAHPQWICIGDFNQILTREEKFSFTQGSIACANLLQQIIS